MIPAVSQAQAEQGAVVPISGWVLVVFALAVLLCVCVSSWQKNRRPERRRGYLDELGRRLK